MKHKNKVCILIMLLISLMIISCTKKAPDTTGEYTKLKVGTIGSINALPLILANENNYFKEFGVAIEIEVYKSSKELEEGIKNSNLDGVFCDVVTLSKYIEEGRDFKITGTSTGYWKGISLKDSGIGVLSDLGGKTIGTSKNTMNEYLVDYLLKKNNVGEVKKEYFDSMEGRINALKANKINFTILPTPLCDLAKAKGSTDFITIDNRDVNLSVIAFGDIENKENVIKNFFKGYNKGIIELNEKGKEAYKEMILRTLNISYEVEKDIVLPKYYENYIPKEENIQRILDWELENNILIKEMKANKIIQSLQ